MALEQPFSNWPFASGEANSRRNPNLKLYQANDSPFKDISPIPGGNRDFGTFPTVDRQPRTVAREHFTKALSNRVSQGFLPPEDIVPDTQFMPIPESQDVIDNRRNVEPQDLLEQNEQVRAPRRGLTLMDRYGGGDRSERPLRRTNSLLEFADYIDRSLDRGSSRRGDASRQLDPRQAQHQRSQRMDRAMLEQQSFRRNGVHSSTGSNQRRGPRGPVRQPSNGPRHTNSIPRQTNSIPRQTNSIPRQTNSIPRHIANGSRRPGSASRRPNGIPQGVPIQAAFPPQQRHVPEAVPRQPIGYRMRQPSRRQRRPRKSGAMSAATVCLVMTGTLVFVAFAAAFITLLALNIGWPLSALLLIGVVIGLLMVLIGCYFCAHVCLGGSRKDSRDSYKRPIIITDPVRDTNAADMHPVWQTSLPRDPVEREEVPMTEFEPLPDQLEERPHLSNGSRHVANGVPTPLAFAAPFSTTPNDYHLY